MALHMTVDDIIVSLILIHQIRKGSLDTGTLLIYRIIKRVHQAVHSLNDFIHIYSIPYLLIKLKKFLPIIYQILEFNTLRMVQEEHIERLVDRTELHFFITKLRQQEVIIRRYDQRTENTLQYYKISSKHRLFKFERSVLVKSRSVFIYSLDIR